MPTHTLRPGEDHIELIKLLKVRDIAQSGGHAKGLVEEGAVRVNGEPESRKRRKLRVGDRVEVGGYTVEVRGVSSAGSGAQ